MAQLKFSKKHKIKEDRFVEWTFDAWQWVQDNARTLTSAGAVVLVVLLIGIFVYKGNLSRTKRAQKAFGTAMISYQGYDTLRAISEFSSVIQHFPKTPHAANSALMLSGIHYGKGDYTNAAWNYKLLHERYGKYDLHKGAGLRGAAYCKIQEKDFAGALTFLQRFVDECPNHFLMPEVLLTLGECQMKLQNPAAARKAFEQLVSKHPKANQVPVARNLLATL